MYFNVAMVFNVSILHSETADCSDKLNDKSEANGTLRLELGKEKTIYFESLLMPRWYNQNGGTLFEDQ